MVLISQAIVSVAAQGNICYDLFRFCVPRICYACVILPCGACASTHIMCLTHSQYIVCLSDFIGIVLGLS